MTLADPSCLQALCVHALAIKGTLNLVSVCMEFEVPKPAVVSV